MWIYNTNENKWIRENSDELSKIEFNSIKQPLKNTRYYSKGISGTGYTHINSLSDIYDITENKKNWVVKDFGSTVNSNLTSVISENTSDEYYNKYLGENAFTMKNLFTPKRMIDDSVKNYKYVDLATTEQIEDITQVFIEFKIDDIVVKEDHRILIKDQVSRETLDKNTDPYSYFTSTFSVIRDYGSTIEYEYHNSDNGIYVYKSGKLVKSNELDLYENSKNSSFVVKLGTQNRERQYHLNKLLNGYYPINSENMLFSENHNWLLRNRIDYNNLFEINYQDVIQHGTSSVSIGGITHSIPDRIISVGEFGVIINTQRGVSSIITNKWKYKLNAISNTKNFYWVAGDNGCILKLNKNFDIQKVETHTTFNLKSIAFYDDNKGVAIGEYNTILITENSGLNWETINISQLDNVSWNKAIYYNTNKIYIVGTNASFAELYKSNDKWVLYKRSIAKYEDIDDVYDLNDDINDINSITTHWNINGNTQGEFLTLTTNNNGIILYDINDIINDKDFIYMNIGLTNIKSCTTATATQSLYINSNNSIYELSLTQSAFMMSNVDKYKNYFDVEPNLYRSRVSDVDINSFKSYDYEFLYVGDNSISKGFTYSTQPITYNLDDTFQSKLKSKMLIMDYDIASKVNFHTDNGDYRLPNSLKISLEQTATYSSNNTTISISDYSIATSSISVTQSLPSISNIDIYVGLSHSYIGDLVINLISPIGDIINLKRLGEGYNSDNISSTFSTNYSLGAFATSSGVYKMSGALNQGVIDGYKSNVRNLDDYLDQTKSTVGNWTLYVYDAYGADFGTLNTWSLCFNNNNTNITSLIDNDSYISFDNTDNWIGYQQDILKDFEYYSSNPLSEVSKVETSTRFDYSATCSYNTISITNSYTAIKNLAPSFENLPYSRYIGGSTPIINPINMSIDIFVYKYLIIIKDAGLGCLLGDSIRLQCGLFDVVYQVVKTFDNWVYLYNDFNENIINDITSQSITVTNLNKYDSVERLVDNFKHHFLHTAYDLTFVDNMFTIIPLYNEQTSYYSLATNVVINDVNYDLKYTDGFNKFGFTPNYNILNYLSDIDDVKFDANKEYLVMPDFFNISLSAGQGSTPDNIYIDYNSNSNKLIFGENLKFEWESIFVNTFVDVNIRTSPFLVYPGFIPGVGNDNFIGPDEILNIDPNYQYLVYDNFTVQGQVNNSGLVRVGGGLLLEGGTFSNHGTVIFSDFNVEDPTFDSMSSNHSTKLLVMKKYKDEVSGKYIIEFHKGMNFPINTLLYNIDIKSRRKLSQISEDLMELNSIHRGVSLRKLETGQEFYNKTNELNFKFNTDSYANILLSDSDTRNSITAILYTDYKNELSFNITQLDKNFNIEINNTENIDGKLLVKCNSEHNLKGSDSVVLSFNGGTGSSSEFNYEYFGYHNIEVVNAYDFIANIPFGTTASIGNDIGNVTYTRTDPFLNYYPVDLIDVGVDYIAKQSIELSQSNLEIVDNKYNLVNVDFEKYRFRLVDGINLEMISKDYMWLLEAEISGAIIGMRNNIITWYKGRWESGRWFGGDWISGDWISGDWYDGRWYSKSIKDNLISIDIDDKTTNSINSKWYDGRWYDGRWDNGRRYNGSWNNGIWNNGIWNNGIWNNGIFRGGVWVLGLWNSGVFNCDWATSYWMNGRWGSGDFENGIWYDGIFTQDNGLSRFGTKSTNSKNSQFRSGIWLSGDIYSGDNTIHKYTIWDTGVWNSGNVYGGVFRNIDFKTGTWHSGVSEDIQILSITGDLLKMNGVYNWNIGDNITFSDSVNEYKSKIAYIKVDDINKTTNIRINSILLDMSIKYRVVSRFGYVNWLSGIWYNGVFEKGMFIGGIWYNGVFKKDAIWN